MTCNYFAVTLSCFISMDHVQIYIKYKIKLIKEMEDIYTHQA